MPSADHPFVKLVLAVVIAAVLVVDGVAVAARQGSGPSAADTPAARDLEAVLPELIAFVEQARGLTFKHPPKVELLSDEDFEDLLTEEDPGSETDDQFDEDVFIGIMRALGLIDGDVDLDAVADDEIRNVVGFYDDRAKVLYGRGVEPTPFVKLVLVHELTHALDDQHFKLDRPELDDEESMAYSALVEGDATWVEDRWYQSRPDEEQEAIQTEESGGTPQNGEPSVFDRMFAFPYVAGPDFVDALRDAGGQARLDAAFATPPVTTEQVLHPERFLAGDGPKAVSAPAADARKVDEGVIGEAVLSLILEGVVGTGVAERASEGWGGDRYVAWRTGGKVCVRFNIVTDTAKDTTELVSALRSWAGAHPGATVRGSDPVSATSCA